MGTTSGSNFTTGSTANLRLLQPTNNARLGGIGETTLQILGKGQFDEVNMEIHLAEIIRGNGQSRVTVNFNRIIRTVNQTTVVMFETLDGTALEEKHDYYGIKKAIIFEPHMTQQQVQIPVNDKYDEDLQDIFFKLTVTIPIDTTPHHSAWQCTAKDIETAFITGGDANLTISGNYLWLRTPKLIPLM